MVDLIKLSGSDFAVFLLKTSCLTRERERESERYTNKMMLFTIAKRNTKSDGIPEIVLTLIAGEHAVLVLQRFTFPCISIHKKNIKHMKWFFYFEENIMIYSQNTTLFTLSMTKSLILPK